MTYATSVHLTREELETLQKLCESNNKCSQSEMIKKAIRDYAEKQNVKHDDLIEAKIT